MSVVETRIEAISRVLFQPSGCDGVYARTALFEQVTDGLSALISRLREPGVEILTFPPVMSRQQLEKSGYLHSFPNLLGCVSSLLGTEYEIRASVENGNGRWMDSLSATDLVLSPAACYPVYPMVAAHRAIPPSSLMFDVTSYCFRREESHELTYLRAFRMREYVCIGTDEQVLAFRARLMRSAEDLARQLELPYQLGAASDPFFGKAGRLTALMQVEQELKFELTVPVHSVERPTACMSFNYHRDHFGKTWSLRTAAGEIARSACVAFGMERIVLALFATHGLDQSKWPASVRQSLSL
jgi:seryl-tRNA synthetase